MKQRGILFTTGILAFSLVILALALVFLSHSQKIAGVVSETMVFEQTYQQYSSTEYNLKKIFLTTAGINVTSNGSTFIFEEMLPNAQASHFRKKIDQFKNFSESHSSNVTLYLDELKENASLVIVPYNITYTHQPWGGKSIYVIPEKMNINRYDVYIEADINISDADLCNWSWGDPGALLLNVSVIGNASSLTSCGWNGGIDPNAGFNLSVSSDNITLALANWRLNITSQLLAPLLVRTRVGVNESSNSTQLAVALSPDIITVSFDEFNLTKKGTVFLN